MSRRRDLVFPRVGWLFAAFIFFCGTGHLVEASIFWWPNYRLSAAVKVGTAIASWGTVIALIPIIPETLKLPGMLEMLNKLQKSTRDQEKAQEALAARNRELEMLLQIVSHDLREPIRGIRGLISMLEQPDSHTPDDDADLVRRISASGKRLDAIVSNMLEYSRIRRSDSARNESVDLNEVAQEAIARLAPAIEHSGATVTIQGTLPVIRGHREWATAAMYNLLSNALRYSGKNGPPEIVIDAIRTADNDWGIVVHDRGPGVENSMKERIFELFRQGINRDPSGTGAGLAIVREVAARHNGRAWVEDRPGGGASFHLTFGQGSVA
jgi:signal transduction histidine kinase